RYKDILGQAYSDSFNTSYMPVNAAVQFSFDVANDAYLSGTLVATGLKPNFAYQIKLSGYSSGDEDNLATNERLGYLGRWWRSAPDPANADDADYNAHKNDTGYVYSGYVIAGLFTTDGDGTGALSIDLNNSFHVLWRLDQRAQNEIDG